MNTPTTVGAFVVGLAGVFGATYGIGNAVGPVGDPPTTHTAGEHVTETEQQYLLRAALAAVRDATLAGGIEGLNYDQLDAGDTSVEAAISIARTLPMMARRRFVLIRQLERWDGKESKTKGMSALDRLGRSNGLNHE